jgi:hypothetical protein
VAEEASTTEENTQLGQKMQAVWDMKADAAAGFPDLLEAAKKNVNYQKEVSAGLSVE